MTGNNIAGMGCGVDVSLENSYTWLGMPTFDIII